MNQGLPPRRRRMGDTWPEACRGQGPFPFRTTGHASVCAISAANINFALPRLAFKWISPPAPLVYPRKTADEERTGRIHHGDRAGRLLLLRFDPPQPCVGGGLRYRPR